MKKTVTAVLLSVMLLSLLAACDGFEGEALTGVVGESLRGGVGESLSYQPRSTFRISGGESMQSGALSGTYYAADGSGSITFSGSDRISLAAPGFDELDAALSLFGGSMTYQISGNYLILTTTMSFMGVQETDTEYLEFEMVSGNSFVLEGTLFEKR